MNPTSLFTSALNLVRRDPAPSVSTEDRQKALFTLPDLPQHTPVRPLEPRPEPEDLRLSEAEQDETQEEERDSETPPELVMMQREESVQTADDLAADAVSEDGLSVLADGRRASRGQPSEVPTPESDSGARGETHEAGEQAQPQRASYRAAHQAAVQQARADQAPEAQGQGAQTGASPGQASTTVSGSGVATPSLTQAATLQNAQAVAAQATPLALQALQQARPGQGEGQEVPVDGIELGELSRSSAPGSLDDLGLQLTEKVLGVAQSQAQSATHGQRPDFSGEVADAVQKLLTEAADDNAMLRFRTEGGQTFLAQARLDPTQGMELRLLSDDPAVRAMLEQRLGDLRSALHRVGFGDAQVQVDRDPSQHGTRDQQRAMPEDETALAPPKARRHTPFVEDAGRDHGRLHLIL